VTLSIFEGIRRFGLGVGCVSLVVGEGENVGDWRGYGQRCRPVDTGVVQGFRFLWLFTLDVTYPAADTPPGSSFRPP